MEEAATDHDVEISSAPLHAILQVLSSISTLTRNISMTRSQQDLLQALAITIHFVSQDCTVSEEHSAAVAAATSSVAVGHSSSGASAAARRIRDTILCHHEGMQGLLYLILSDPIVSTLRSDTRYEATVKQNSSSPFVLPSSSPSKTTGEPASSPRRLRVNGELSTTRTQELSPTSSTGGSSIGDDSLATPDSQSSSSSVDPTKAGRRRKKRQRVMLDVPALESIPEHPDSSAPNIEASNSMQHPATSNRDGVSVKGGSPSLSFASSLESKNRASAASGDSPSVSSTDSYTVKLSLKYEKAQQRALSHMENHDTVSHSRLCRVEEKKLGLASFLGTCGFKTYHCGKERN